MVVLLYLALFLSFSPFSSAEYCLCKSGSQVADPYKKVIDYACGNGANCGPIQQNMPCYQANSIQNMCSYAANSYYQNKKSMGGTCDFKGVAAPSVAPPTDLPSGCTYPSPTSGGPVSNGTSSTSTPSGGGGINTDTGNNPFGPIGPLGPTGSMDPNGANDARKFTIHAVSFSVPILLGLLISWA